MTQPILPRPYHHLHAASCVNTQQPKEISKYIRDLIRFLPDKQFIGQNSVAYYQCKVFLKDRIDRHEEQLNAFLSSLSIDEVKNLHKTLMPIFTSNIGNAERLELVKIFHILGSDRMTTFARNIHFLIPNDSTGSDILYIAQLLSSIRLDHFQDLLVSATCQLFDCNTSNHHRTMILLYLYNKDSDELREIVSKTLEKKQELTRTICKIFP